MTPRLVIFPAVVTSAVFIGPLVIALWRGGWRERLVAALWAAGYVATWIHPLNLDPANHVPRGVRSLVDDTLLLAGCLVSLWRARRYWVVWASALALLSVVTDTLFLVLPDIHDFVFIYADDIWGYALCAIVAWAALTHRRAAPDRPLAA